jgi:hypothetical protein
MIKHEARHNSRYLKGKRAMINARIAKVQVKER